MKRISLSVAIIFIIFFSLDYFVISQNDINISVDENITITPENITTCGDGIIQQPNSNNINEQCDNGTNNTNTPCLAEYQQECNYCDTNCKNITINGGYCGDRKCQKEKEDYQNCPVDNCEIPPKNECIFDDDCKEKPDDKPCTENKCLGEPKKCYSNNIDGKRELDKWYCLNGNQENQKDEDESCNENYECKSNACTEGTCLRVRPGFIQKVFEFFGLSRLYDWLRANGWL